MPISRFEIDDAEDEWIYSYQFDYIHGRYICPFMTDVPKFIRNIYENVKPGGHVEIMETLMLIEAVDNSLEGTALEKWGKMTREGKFAITVETFLSTQPSQELILDAN